jgi:hypothetical protein
MESRYVPSWFLRINFVPVAAQTRVSEPLASNGLFVLLNYSGFQPSCHIMYISFYNIYYFVCIILVDTVRPVLDGPYIKRSFVLNGNIFRSRDYHSITSLNGNLASAEKMFWTLQIPFNTSFFLFGL